VLVIYSLAKDWNSQGHERMFSALLSSGKFVVEICRWYSEHRGVSVADLRVDEFLLAGRATAALGILTGIDYFVALPQSITIGLKNIIINFFPFYILPLPHLLYGRPISIIIIFREWCFARMSLRFSSRTNINRFGMASSEMIVRLISAPSSKSCVMLVELEI
jgi:hypothetical protein